MRVLFVREGTVKTCKRHFVEAICLDMEQSCYKQGQQTEADEDSGVSNFPLFMMHKLELLRQKIRKECMLFKRGL